MRRTACADLDNIAIHNEDAGFVYAALVEICTVGRYVLTRNHDPTMASLYAIGVRLKVVSDR